MSGTESERSSLPAAEAVRLLAERRLTLAVAESSTGGLIGHLITGVPGSSAVFLGGVIAYANALKEKLGMSPALIEKRGAVSGEVASAMAESVRRQTGADYALAVTGIAGPGGGTAAKPVGLTYIALALLTGTIVEERRFEGGRSSIKRASAIAALDLLVRVVAPEM